MLYSTLPGTHNYIVVSANNEFSGCYWLLKRPECGFMLSAPSFWNRTFWTFPGGRPGIGLLLLRIALGAELVWFSYARLEPWQGGGPVMKVGAVLALLCAACIVGGFRTALSSLLAGMISVVFLISWIFSPIPDTEALRIGAASAAFIAAALVFLGPGGFSVDGRLYGHREIVIPGVAESESDV